MKKVIVVVICMFLFLLGCDNNVSNEPIKAETKVYDFILSIETNKRVYEEEDPINVFSYFEYVGEGIQLNTEPLITIVVQNRQNGNIIKQMDYHDIQKSMKKGEKFSQSIEGFNLKKGKYAIYGSANFSIGASYFLANTEPIFINVK